jgi:hypothetical protein
MKATAMHDTHALTPDEVAAMPLWQRICFAIHPFNAFGRASFKTVDEWAEWAASLGEVGAGLVADRVLAEVDRALSDERKARELAAEKQRKDAALARANAAEQARLKAERKTKRIEKRIHAGVCPCCNRTFQNLARHMNTKHPDEASNVLRIGALPLPK